MTVHAVPLVLTDAPTADDLSIISDSLDGFNVETTGLHDRVPLAVLVHDPVTGETVGGLTGRTSMGLWIVDLLYLPESLRGSGVGTRLLAEAEAEACRRGCTSGVLYTISFQAPEFYKRYGWVEFGRIPCLPEGTSRIFLTKILD
jgi:GNAT superfamily N-acetyltransferase